MSAVILERAALLLPAAGAGQRMGGRRKQFRLLGGKPLLLRTLEVFLAHEGIGTIVIAVPEKERETVEVWVREMASVRIVAGGATRQASVFRAFDALQPEEATAGVLVHDAVRPFIRQEDIDRVLTGIRETGAAALAVPVVDTLRRYAEAWLTETVPREGLVRMQTPQGARYELFRKAVMLARERGLEATDEVALLQASGVRVQWVSGTPYNIKITTPEDWQFAERFWPCWEQMQGGASCV